MALDGEVDVALSQPILGETLRVLKEKFQAAPKELQTYRTIMEAASNMVVPRVNLDVVKDDPDDDKIVECAVSARADAIITADNHLLKIGLYDSIRMMQVVEFLGRQR